MTLEVDATNTGQWLFQVHQTIPAQPGTLRLLYPRWLPGTHGPTGDPSQIAGLTVHVGASPGGERLAWQRPHDNLHAFDVQVPAGAQALRLSFQWLGANRSSPYPPPLSRDLFGIQWPALLLYPAGYAASAISVHTRLKLPPGFGWGSALRARSAPVPAAGAAAAANDGWIDFEPVSLETLIDSPLYAGAAYRRIELDAPGTAQPAVLHLFSDRSTAYSKAPVPTEAQIEAHRQLFVQTEKLFGSRPWRQYDLLLANLKGLKHDALEHHESSENAYDGRYFDNWSEAARRRDDVAHELVHAWNGKYRRPADLWTADLNTLSSNSLLWVYEGLTQYWGLVIAARSGLITPEQAQRELALDAAWYQNLPGRRWRSLQDTTHDPAINSATENAWYTWSRGYDYYSESALNIWLDADTLIREQTRGQAAGPRSLDDFARAFFGGRSGDKGPELYTFDDVVRAMNDVLAHDWRSFFRQRLDRTVAFAAPEGLTRAGWKVEFRDTRSALDLASLDPEKPSLNLTHSLGVSIGKDGALRHVQWDSAAFREGLTVGDKVVAVNLQAYTPERLEAALVANKAPNDEAVELLLQRDDRFLVKRLNTRSGPRFPAAARIEGTPDLLADILKPR